MTKMQFAVAIAILLAGCSSSPPPTPTPAPEAPMIGSIVRLDPALDAELMIAGRAAWQVLAGAAGGAFLRGQLRCAAAPFDVTYLVASWLADG